MKKLSGIDWVQLFQGSLSVKDLASPFRNNVERFLLSLKESGAKITISATFRPPQRAYLMHWAWMIAHRKISPENVPAFSGVNINWVHESVDKSIRAAESMVNAYGMQHLHVAPALKSRHTEGNAIDMNISWRDSLRLKDTKGAIVEIKTLPCSGMNAELHKVAKNYGVIKFKGGIKDAPHWSTDGR